MFFIYNILQLIGIIIFLPFILIAFLSVKKFRFGFLKKLGFFESKDDLKKTENILIHAVSVGEINAVENFINKVLENTNRNEHKILISTVTKTGYELAKKKFENKVDGIFCFPFDFRFSVKTFFKKLSLKKVIIAETEIWPNFVNIAEKMNIELYIINGRISPNSYCGYKKLGFFFARILNKYTKILMQTKDDASRIVDIGANENLVKVMGNLKFDITRTLNDQQVNLLKAQLMLDGKKLMIAGSTHKGEDEIVINIYKKLKENNSNFKMMLVPRHPERYSEVINLLKKENLKFGKRSENDNFSDNDVILLDTMGELGKLYSICDFAFIGGSFVKTGGHNPLEATVWEKPTISGPFYFNFKDVYNILKNKNSAFIVNNEDEFYKVANKLAYDNEFYNLSKQNCKDVFVENSGAVDKAYKLIFE